METFYNKKISSYEKAIPIRIYEEFQDAAIHELAVEIYELLKPIMNDVGNRTDVHGKRLVIVYSVLKALKKATLKNGAIYNNIDTAQLSKKKLKERNIISRAYIGKKYSRYARNVFISKGSGVLWAMCKAGMLKKSVSSELKAAKVGHIKWIANRYLPTEDFMCDYAEYLYEDKEVDFTKTIIAKDREKNIIQGGSSKDIAVKKATLEAFLTEYNNHIENFDITINSIPIICADGIVYLKSKNPYKELNYHAVLNNVDLGPDMGYRLYSNFTQLPKESRLLTRVDGEQLVGIDIKTSCPTIAFHLEGLSAPKDIYTDIYHQRKVAKIIWGFLTNSKNAMKDDDFCSAKLLRIKVNYIIKENNGNQLIDSSEEIQLHNIPDEIKHNIEKFNGKYGMFLINHETNIVVRILKELMARNMFCCSVHDCIYVKESDLDAAINAIKVQWDTYIAEYRGEDANGSYIPSIGIEAIEQNC